MPSYTGYEALAVSTASVGFTAATYGTAINARCSVETGAIRFRMDGTDPTATQGEVAEPGDILAFESPDEIQRVRFVRRDGWDATLRVHFGK